jgi:methylmalonyl-CoA/ethylmalonyl-CoA epimerase
VIDRIVLDHVAVAVEARHSTWARYGHDLPPTRYLGGGIGYGFSNYQVEYPGLRLEVLRPAGVEDSDFLRRFLDRSGPGPHHLTYKVDDISAAIAAVEQAGYRPVGVNLADATWKEAFLHPRDIPGVVVQLAWTTNQWEAESPEGWPARRTVRDAVLERVVHGVADLDEGLRLFAGLLGGEETARGEDPEGRWVEVAWAAGGRVRLVTPTSGRSPLARWIDGRPGRVHHLAFATERPSEVADAIALEGAEHPTWEVPPERNQGSRLRLRALD